MSVRQIPAVLLQREEIVEAPAQRASVDHSFEFPTRIYAAMAALLFGFMAVMAVGFAHPRMVVPMAVNFVFLTAFFAVPVIFVTGSPATGRGALSWSDFMSRGVDTATGHCPGREAVVLTLMLPFLILCWGLVVVAIAAFV
ncbi:MAG TPA: hypothetical protein VFS45_01345 [Sphingomicrobium sp.]|nr:hypothetical protein [Sphingomicrobium sp.]